MPIDPQRLKLDPCDEHLRTAETWYPDTDGYARSMKLAVLRQPSHLHRIITNAPKGSIIDHINGDPLDNRRENLRVVTCVENGQNRTRPQKNNKSGYRGVHWVARHGKWRAAAKLRGKTYFIGLFATKELAAEAARAWREQHFSGVTQYSDGHKTGEEVSV